MNKLRIEPRTWLEEKMFEHFMHFFCSVRFFRLKVGMERHVSANIDVFLQE